MLKKVLRSSVKTNSSTSSSTARKISCLFHTSTKSEASVYEDLKTLNPDEAFPWIEHNIPKRHAQHPYEISSLSFNGLGKSKKPPNPIVFIHDYTTNSKVFSTIARKLNYPYGIVTMDLKGRGKTQVTDLNQLYNTQEEKEKTSGSLNLVNHALDFVRLLTYYGLPRAFVVGHGFGANIAYMLMNKCPDRISGAVLINGGYPINKASMADVTQLHEKIASTFASPNEALFLQGAVNSENIDFKSFVEFSKSQNNDDVRLAATKDLRSLEDYAPSLEELIRLRHPIALIRSEHGLKDGDKKPIIDTKVLKSMETTLNTKSVITVNGSNHYNMLFDEKYAEQIANTIDKFVSGYDIHKIIEQRFVDIKGTDDIKAEE